MIWLLKLLTIAALISIALGLLFAVRIGRPRPPPADPFSKPFGDVPEHDRFYRATTARMPE